MFKAIESIHIYGRPATIWQRRVMFMKMYTVTFNSRTTDVPQEPYRAMYRWEWSKDLAISNMVAAVESVRIMYAAKDNLEWSRQRIDAAVERDARQKNEIQDDTRQGKGEEIVWP